MHILNIPVSFFLSTEQRHFEAPRKAHRKVSVSESLFIDISDKRSRAKLGILFEERNTVSIFKRYKKNVFSNGSYLKRKKQNWYNELVLQVDTGLVVNIDSVKTVTPAVKIKATTPAIINDSNKKILKIITFSVIK